MLKEWQISVSRAQNKERVQQQMRLESKQGPDHEDFQYS